jgi:hypothetical protein
MIALHATAATAPLMAKRIGEVCFHINRNDFCTVETDDMGTWCCVYTHDPLDMVKTLEEEGFL